MGSSKPAARKCGSSKVTSSNQKPALVTCRADCHRSAPASASATPRPPSAIAADVLSAHVRQPGGFAAELPAGPHPVDGQAGQHHQQADGAVDRIDANLVEGNRERRDREGDRDERHRRHPPLRPVVRAPTQQHDADGEQREEDPLGIDHAREQLPVGAGHDQHRGPCSLQRDGASGSAIDRMHVGGPLEQQAVLRHRVVHPRAGEDDAVQRAESGDHDQRRNSAAAGRPDQRLERVRRDARRGNDAVDGQDRQIDDVQPDIAGRDDQRADDQRSRNRALRVLVSSAV